MDPKFRQRLEKILREARTDHDRLHMAYFHELQVIDQIELEDNDAAIASAQIAAALYDQLSESEKASESKRLEARLAKARILVTQGALQRRAKQPADSANTFAIVERLLNQIHDDVFRPRKPDGIRGLIPVLNKPRQNIDLITDWVRAKGALLMNNGVLLDETGHPSEALAVWREAEVTLFDEYVKLVGPEEDVETTGKIINLWENILTTALATGDADRAAEVAGNAMKLFAYWVAQGTQHPPEVVEAFGAFAGTFAELDQDHRALISTKLPAPLIETLDNLTTGE